MTTKETIENNIKTIYENLNTNLNLLKYHYSPDYVKDDISESLIHQYVETRKVSNEETVRFKISVKIDQFSDNFRILVTDGEVMVNQNMVLKSVIQPEGDDFKYYKKRLLNLLKDNKHLKLEVTDGEVNKDGVTFKTTLQLNKQEILTKIARIAVATFAQKNLKSRATVEQDGVKIEVFREEVK